LIIDMVSEHASPLAVLGGAEAGGQNVHVAALATELGRRGHEVTVHTRRDRSDLPDRVRLAPGVTVEHVRAGPAEFIARDDLFPYMHEFAERLHDRWRNGRRPQIVHGHFWTSGLAALQATRPLGIPLAQTFHALGVVKRRHQGDLDTSPPERTHIEELLVREAEVVIATCFDEVQELSALGVRLDGIEVVPCGIDLDLFHPARGPVPVPDRWRVLSLGRLVRRKGVDTIIEAMARVPSAELLVAGGPDSDELANDPEARRLRELADRRGIADRVSFLGRIPHDRVPGLIRSADVVVSVPAYEPFGIVPVEAMGCGVPVIASAVGGHLSTVVDGQTGLLVPPGDPEALAGRLRSLFSDRYRRVRLGTAGAERAQRLYSWGRVASETEAAYVRAVSAHTRLTSSEGAIS
jgi:D-inositol-3-phosphate glycosyltransferase